MINRIVRRDKFFSAAGLVHHSNQLEPMNKYFSATRSSLAEFGNYYDKIIIYYLGFVKLLAIVHGE